MLGNQQLWACQHYSSVHYMASNRKVLWSSLQPQYLTSSHLAHRLCAMASLGYFGPVKEEFQDESVPWFQQELFNFIAMFIHFPLQPCSHSDIFRYCQSGRRCSIRWQSEVNSWGVDSENGWGQALVDPNGIHNWSQHVITQIGKNHNLKPVPRFAQSSTWAVGCGNSWVLTTARRVSYWFLGLNWIELV